MSGLFHVCLFLCLFLFIHLSRSCMYFLGATKHLYNWLCPLVGRSVGWSVGLLVTHSFDDPHRRTYWPTWPCFYLGTLNDT